MSSIKNITFISLNYAPEDTAIGLYSTQWVEFLKDAGYNITVVTAFPYYPQWKISQEYRSKRRFVKENNNGITVLRYKQYVPKKPTFFKRIIHLLDFTMGSFFNLFKIKECDLVISIVPFTTSTLLGHIQKKRFKAKLWIHIQDFEFDAALQTGMGKKTRLVFSILFKLEKWLFSKANLSSTISQSMLNLLSKKTNSEQFFLPNWIDHDSINPEKSKPHKYLLSPKTKILYSGNIGDKQDWEVFIKFCNDIDAEEYEVVLVGDGSKKEWVLGQIAEYNHVKYHPPVPFEDLSDLLCSTDVHILFQKPEVIDTVMPSKVLGMMASGKPSIIIGNEKSEVKSIFDNSKSGFYFTKYSTEVSIVLKKLYPDSGGGMSTELNSREYVIENFSKEKILGKMLNKLQEL